MQTAPHIPDSEAPADSPLLDSPPIPQLPPLSHEDQVSLEFYFAQNEDLLAIARKTKHRYTALLAWTTQPHIAAYIRAARIHRIQRQRDDALAELQHITNTSRDPIERRRAASTLLRATDPARWSRARRPRAIIQSAGAEPASQAPAAQHQAHASPPHDNEPPSTAPSASPAPSGSSDPSHARDPSDACEQPPATHLAEPADAPRERIATDDDDLNHPDSLDDDLDDDHDLDDDDGLDDEHDPDDEGDLEDLHDLDPLAGPGIAPPDG